MRGTQIWGWWPLQLWSCLVIIQVLLPHTTLPDLWNSPFFSLSLPWFLLRLLITVSPIINVKSWLFLIPPCYKSLPPLSQAQNYFPIQVFYQMLDVRVRKLPSLIYVQSNMSYTSYGLHSKGGQTLKQDAQEDWNVYPWRYSHLDQAKC